MSPAPKKYCKVNGVMQLNPEYKKWTEAQSGGVPVTTVASPQALPIVSSMQDHEELNEIVVAGGGTQWGLAESTNASIEMMQEPDICMAAGMTSDSMVDELGAILNKYEVPLGLVNKLLMLSEFQVLEFIIDDSGSMSLDSDTVDVRTGRPQSRWMEAKVRLKEMLEVLAYVPFEMIDIGFLNRGDRVVLKREGRDPRTFLADAYSKVDAVFSRGPSGGTPALEKLRDSINRGRGKNIARYFFGDGTPNGGKQAEKEILNLIMNRQDPVNNPMTFISCTNEDSAVEWMKDIEEIAPYCSESDDFADEAQEVLRDQGAALPYSKGFHLVCQLVAAMCPDDLDAMDESVPFTKTTLDNLLGVQHNEESYRHYFNCFQEAQRMRTVHAPSDSLKKSIKWDDIQFLRASTAKEIPQVREFKESIKRLE